jgi:protein-tyrosine kinase
MQNNTVTQFNLPASKIQTLEPFVGKTNGVGYETKFGQDRFGSELIAISQPYAPQVEALRMLHGQLMMRWFNDEHRSLAVISTKAGEGCSYLAANLAVIFAQLGQRTLLIDANLRGPRQHLIFKLKANIGLSDILAGHADIGSSSQLESVENLSVLSAGTAASNPLELLSRASFRGLMKQAIAQYDVVLVDTAPVTMTADAQVTVAHIGSALLVSRLNHTKFSDLTEMRDQIAITGAQIVGGVINEF